MDLPTNNEDEFWQYVENPDDPELKQRIEQFKDQQQQADAFIKLRRLLFRSTCPTAHELGEYYLGQLSRAEVKAVRNHLNRCPHCTRELLTYKAFMGEGEPQPAVIEQMKIMIARLWREVSPNYPSWQPTFAIRGEEATVYLADEDVQIALRSQEDASHPGFKMLVGLITGIPTENLSIHLWSADQLLATTRVDSLGNFLFEKLKAQTYELVVQGEELLIQLGNFSV
jgi:hypothetical protein